MYGEITNRLLFILGLGATLFVIYTGIFGRFAEPIQRGFHLLMLLPFGFLVSGSKIFKEDSIPEKIINVALALLAFGSVLYYLNNWVKVYKSSGVDQMDMVWGVIGLFCVIELTRRTMGMAIVIIGLVGIAYLYIGPYIPSEILAHRGFGADEIIYNIWYTLQGVWGSPLGVSATMVILFVIFGCLMEVMGASDYLIKLSVAIAGRYSGAPAKIAVVSSSLFGTISGAAAANVAVTGNITIPMMKRSGFAPHVAGAVEATASIGGQIMPPILGATAFIMADFIGVSYWKVALAAVIPALLYYTCIYMNVHAYSVRQGLTGLNPQEIPRFWPVFKSGLHYVIPLVVLITMLFMEFTIDPTVTVSIFVLVLVSYFKKKTRVSIKTFSEALLQAARSVLPVAVICAFAGVIISIFSITGIGLKVSSIVLAISGGHLFLALVMTMIMSIILGMGMPTPAAYIILAILAVPALQNMGAALLPAHFFVFYFGVMSGITPPVAVAAYVASGIAKCGFWKLCGVALKFAVSGFVIPYLFIYYPALLIVDASIWATVSMAIISFAFILGVGMLWNGMAFKRVSSLERLLAGIAAGALLVPYDYIRFPAVVLVLAILYKNFMKGRKGSALSELPSPQVILKP